MRNFCKKLLKFPKLWGFHLQTPVGLRSLGSLPPPPIWYSYLLLQLVSSCVSSANACQKQTKATILLLRLFFVSILRFCWCWPTNNFVAKASLDLNSTLYNNIQQYERLKILAFQNFNNYKLLKEMSR